MDRREFLKSLGLGGLALTLPKSLEVVAATVRGLEAPIHVGFSSFRKGGFSVDDVGVILPRSARPDDTARLRNWTLRVILRRNAGQYFPIMQDAVMNRLWGPGYPSQEEIDRRSGAIMKGASLNVLEGDTIEAWLSPEGRPDGILPRVHIGCQARRHGMPLVGTIKVRTVQIERARAIELGLAGADEEFETV